MLFLNPIVIYRRFYSVGGVYGNKFVLWDISKLRGGLPTVTGSTFPEGGSIFRCACPSSYPFFSLWSLVLQMVSDLPRTLRNFYPVI